MIKTNTKLNLLLEQYNPIKMSSIHQISDGIILYAIENISTENNTKEINLISFVSYFGLLAGLVLFKFYAHDRKKMLARVKKILEARNEEGNFDVMHLLPAPEIINTIKNLLSQDDSQPILNITNDMVDGPDEIRQKLTASFAAIIDQVTRQFDQRNDFYHDLLFFLLIDITQFMMIICYSKRTDDKNIDIELLAKKICENIYKGSSYTDVQISENLVTAETLH
ncbi:MAG TPA: hypothetical protein VLI69_00830 [Gammaproteobacteria bacterium]|nr:hypothetical protein [Gammaproteobacteria bacterium]